MARPPRKHIIERDLPGIYHCWSRCVRGARLMGKDRSTKKDYSHRKKWVEERVEELAAWFAIDVVFYAVMENHFHLVLHTLPQVVAKWSAENVIVRAAKIFPYKFKMLVVKDGEMTNAQLRNFARDRKLVKEMRSRLSDPSWFLRQLKQHIATRCNKEDDTQGHFFEGRFHCKAILDEAGIVTCGVYVDLNEIHAGAAQSVAGSTRTSAYRRLKAWKARRMGNAKDADADSFLCPIHVKGDGQGGDPPAGQIGSSRASDTGVLEMTVEQYLEVLDWGKPPGETRQTLQGVGRRASDSRARGAQRLDADGLRGGIRGALSPGGGKAR